MSMSQDLTYLALYQRGALYGANLVAAEFDDAQIVTWGPRGCSSPILESQLAQRQECHFRCYPVSQTDILTNGLGSLKRSLIPHVTNYNVKGPLFLFMGDAPKLTSEDIEGFIQTSLPAGFPIVHVDTGFRGGYWVGVNEALYKTVKRFCVEKRPTQPKLVNLIPDVGTSPQWRANARELARLLALFGVEANIFPNRNNIPDLARITAAGHTILVNHQVGAKAASHLQERFGIRTCSPKVMPIGLEGTELWLKAVAEATGLIDGKQLEQVIEEETLEYFLAMRPALRDDNYKNRVDVLRTSRFLVCDEANRAVEWSRMLVNELDMQGGHVFPTEGSGAVVTAAGDDVALVPDGAALAARCDDKGVSVILGSDWLMECCGRRIDNLVYVSHPVIRRITLVPKPFYGFRGAVHFLEDVLNCITY